MKWSTMWKAGLQPQALSRAGASALLLGSFDSLGTECERRAVLQGGGRLSPITHHPPPNITWSPLDC